MANPPTSNNISHQLTDRSGTPLISSSSSSQPQSNTQAQPPTSLTTSAMIAYDTASRLGLGLPQRILIETSSAPMILHSFLNPQASRPPRAGRGIVEQAREELRPLSGTTESSSVEGDVGAELQVKGAEYGKYGEDEEQVEEEGNARQVPPMLVGTVVAATSADAGEARRTAARLERMGREFQKEWIREMEAASEAVTAAENEEG